MNYKIETERYYIRFIGEYALITNKDTNECFSTKSQYFLSNEDNDYGAEFFFKKNLLANVIYYILKYELY